MRFPDETLITPIYIKTKEDMPWPDERVFYVLSANGLFLCRNNAFFRSCVPAQAPRELAKQDIGLDLRYPRIPRHHLEAAVGFFGAVGEKHGAEASLLLIWDTLEKMVRLFAPRQISVIHESYYGQKYPIGVTYEVPIHLPKGWVIFGDIHSHVDGSAYASMTDKLDEIYRPGLHIVIGRIRNEPPDFHVEATVDGVRFELEPGDVLEGYIQRRTKISRRWFKKLKIKSIEKGESI